MRSNQERAAGPPGPLTGSTTGSRTWDHAARPQGNEDKPRAQETGVNQARNSREHSRHSPDQGGTVNPESNPKGLNPTPERIELIS